MGSTENGWTHLYWLSPSFLIRFGFAMSLETGKGSCCNLASLQSPLWWPELIKVPFLLHCCGHRLSYFSKPEGSHGFHRNRQKSESHTINSVQWPDLSSSKYDLDFQFPSRSSPRHLGHRDIQSYLVYVGIQILWECPPTYDLPCGK